MTAQKTLIAVMFMFFIALTVNPADLKLLWWNVENFFDMTDDPLKNDTVLTREQYAFKLAGVSAELIDVSADIVGLGEVENAGVLKDIVVKAGYPFYYFIAGNDTRGINVCLLSRYKVDYITHRDQPAPYKGNAVYKFSRDCSESVLDIEGKKVHILVTHLKSQSGGELDALEKRVAQVNGILDIISGIYGRSDGEPDIILMGDFNSYRFSEPMNILFKSGLVIINYLYNESDVYTYTFRKENNDIDYFLINKPFYDKLKLKGFKVFHDKKLKKISDHYPVFMEIEF